MRLKIGIDVGGTFTDFLVTSEDREPKIYKVLSTPAEKATATRPQSRRACSKCSRLALTVGKRRFVDTVQYSDN